MSSSGSGSATLVQPGMQVFGSDAEPVGMVKEKRSGGFVVSQAKRDDIFVPRDVVSEVSEAERRVDLTVRASELPKVEPGVH
jgi:hypothetical protein